jgi:hypothetical protein
MIAIDADALGGDERAMTRIARNGCRLLLALALAARALGCDGDRPEPPREPPPRPAAPGTAAAASGSAAPPPPTSEASPSAATPPPSLVGVWHGRYEAKKGSIELPPKVPGKTWDKDDGKVATGAGDVTLEIGPDGTVKGTAAGALGKQVVSGHLEGTMLRTSVMPEDPATAPAMSGVLVGVVKGETIHAEIRVAGGADASLIRESKIELARKK